MTLTQSGLARRVVKVLGIHSKYSTPTATPDKCAALPFNSGGEPAVGISNYSAVIGMLLFLRGISAWLCIYSPPVCTVHFWTRSFSQTRHQAHRALSQGHSYLCSYSQPWTHNLCQLLCYPNADFVGLWGHKYPQDPHYARSCTGYIIILAGYPVLWCSKLQTEIVHATMES